MRSIHTNILLSFIFSVVTTAPTFSSRSKAFKQRNLDSFHQLEYKQPFEKTKIKKPTIFYSDGG